MPCPLTSFKLSVQTPTLRAPPGTVKPDGLNSDSAYRAQCVVKINRGVAPLQSNAPNRSSASTLAKWSGRLQDCVHTSKAEAACNRLASTRVADPRPAVSTSIEYFVLWAGTIKVRCGGEQPMDGQPKCQIPVQRRHSDDTPVLESSSTRKTQALKLRLPEGSYSSRTRRLLKRKDFPPTSRTSVRVTIPVPQMTVGAPSRRDQTLPGWLISNRKSGPSFAPKTVSVFEPSRVRAPG
jgi:hypothetical protein